VTNETSTEYFHFFCPEEDFEVGAQVVGKINNFIFKALIFCEKEKVLLEFENS
jgi:hypothetical protein